MRPRRSRVARGAEAAHVTRGAGVTARGGGRPVLELAPPHYMVARSHHLVALVARVTSRAGHERVAAGASLAVGARIGAVVAPKCDGVIGWDVARWKVRPGGDRAEPSASRVAGCAHTHAHGRRSPRRVVVARDTGRGGGLRMAPDLGRGARLGVALGATDQAPAAIGAMTGVAEVEVADDHTPEASGRPRARLVARRAGAHHGGSRRRRLARVAPAAHGVIGRRELASLVEGVAVSAAHVKAHALFHRAVVEVGTVRELGGEGATSSGRRIGRKGGAASPGRFDGGVAGLAKRPGLREELLAVAAAVITGGVVVGAGARRSSRAHRIGRVALDACDLGVSAVGEPARVGLDRTRSARAASIAAARAGQERTCKRQRQRRKRRAIGCPRHR